MAPRKTASPTFARRGAERLDTAGGGVARPIHRSRPSTSSGAAAVPVERTVRAVDEGHSYRARRARHREPRTVRRSKTCLGSPRFGAPGALTDAVASDPAPPPAADVASSRGPTQTKRGSHQASPRSLPRSGRARTRRTCASDRRRIFVLRRAGLVRTRWRVRSTRDGALHARGPDGAWTPRTTVAALSGARASGTGARGGGARWRRAESPGARR